MALLPAWGGDPFTVAVATDPAETPSPAAVLDAIARAKVKPAGFRVIHTFYNAPWEVWQSQRTTWADIEAAGSWSELQSTFPD